MSTDRVQTRVDHLVEFVHKAAKDETPDYDPLPAMFIWYNDTVFVFPYAGNFGEIEKRLFVGSIRLLATTTKPTEIGFLSPVWHKVFPADTDVPRQQVSSYKDKDEGVLINVESSTGDFKSLILPVIRSLEEPSYAAPTMVRESGNGEQQAIGNVLNYFKLDASTTGYESIPGMVRMVNHILPALKKKGWPLDYKAIEATMQAMPVDMIEAASSLQSVTLDAQQIADDKQLDEYCQRVGAGASVPNGLGGFTSAHAKRPNAPSTDTRH